jgi:hypothetical protein
MGYHPRFAIWAIGGESDAETIDLARRALFHLCISLCKINYDLLKSPKIPKIPPLYKAGVRYHDDSHLDCWKGTCRIQEDDWQDIKVCLAKKYADCEDLACWRCAELWIQGVNALPFPVLQNGGKDEAQLWHIQVLLPDGTIEDPSVHLGMNAES